MFTRPKPGGTFGTVIFVFLLRKFCRKTSHAHREWIYPLTLHEVTFPLKKRDTAVTGICGILRNVTELTRANFPAPTIIEEYPSAAMKSVLKQARMAAAADIVVLLLRESGSGKNYLARWIHEHSGRSRGPFLFSIARRLPTEIAESELFGHEIGAFSGASYV